MPTTTLYNRGAIILLPFPFSDQSSVKLRPTVVVNPPYSSDDLLVVAVTSVGEVLRPGEFEIQRWREAGLLHPSFAKRAIASVSRNLVRRKIGQLDQGDLVRLNDALRLWFGLSRAFLAQSPVISPEPDTCLRTSGGWP
jgi:mRNA interferase MazF